MGCHKDKNVDSETRDRQGIDYSLQKDLNATDTPDFLWNEFIQSEEDISSMFNETTTPIKDCLDLAYLVSHSEVRNKEPEDGSQTCSLVKKRRRLQLDTQALDPPNSSQDMSSVFLKSNEREDFEEFSPEMSQLISGFSDASASSYDAVDQSSESWLADCLNDTETTFSPDDANFSGETDDVQIDISEFLPPENEATPVQERCVSRSSKNVIFKARKSYARSPTKLVSSVAYPFTFIKPCGIRGDVTLKDINQRICPPPPSKSKQTDEDSFPTSAFSGKPVVEKTKIRTEGGKGSITILRTRG